MQKIFNYLIIALLLVTTASSCKKWLDVTPGNQVRAEDQFTSEAGFRDALMGIYISMTDKGAYAKNISWGALDFLAQPYRRAGSTSGFFEMQVYQYNTPGAMEIVEAMWKGNYNSISNINSALDNLEKKKGVVHPISYSIIKGELLGLRAFLHFDLLRLYGRSNFAGRPELAGKPAIPYVTSFSKEVTPQLSYAKTFELMEKDINEAAALLKEDPIYKNNNHPESYYAEVNRTGFFDNRHLRMNYYAVKALQARVLLWQGSAAKMAEAATAANEVITGSAARLISADNPVKDVIMKSEFVFALNIDRFYDIINFSLQPILTDDGVYMFETNYHTVYELNNTVGLSDFRQLNWFTDMGTADKTWVLRKLYQNAGNTETRNMLPLMRISEMYYIMAEARMSTDLAESIELLNTVRRSRGIVQDIPSNADAQTVSGELTKEYQKDFVQEGQLFFYYKRRGFTSFFGLPANTTANDLIYMLPYPDSEQGSGNREQ
ncbi:RagB/SusD family nutrient uptake outer membrane protein [Pseudoflavitalea rhizosphaerae]|uniref:RagB/SusD family nutrient uptake outer membrane protein n=1 Tax=Pseudoflavitalea rhizosphaerae TaxID=1884793 RepID=UPI000F8DC938|nr:RagB/SusD family nutrient uptake outer membrane protein [Pseudoflavitalea rhizosphaerae]